MGKILLFCLLPIFCLAEDKKENVPAITSDTAAAAVATEAPPSTELTGVPVVPGYSCPEGVCDTHVFGGSLGDKTNPSPGDEGSPPGTTGGVKH